MPTSSTRTPFSLWLSLPLLLLLGATLAGCGGGNRGLTPEEVEITPGAPTEGALGDGDGEATATGLGGDGSLSSTAAGADAATDGNAAAPPQRVVYFEYDSSALSAEGKATVQAHARQLLASGAQVVLEGHADERGTREYNLALAEDRAKAVSDFLQELMIDPARIQSVSYGEERPIALGHDEASWHLNRRVEILY